MTEVRVISPGKINLFLEILAERPDGYHDIRTLMQMVDLFDEIILKRQEKGIELRLFGHSGGVPTGEANLAYRAARLLFQEIGIPAGVSIDLHKRIPPGGGLGGGSSNAAATLWGLKILFGLSASRAQLLDLSLSLGSDVPFFLTSGCAIGEGRGEVLKEVDLPSKPVVIIYPGFGVSTGWAYKRKKMKLTHADKRSKFERLQKDLSRGEFPPLLGNDLEEVVAEEYPLIYDLKRTLLNSGAASALMSGSGSSVYGIFDDPARAAEVAGQWRSRNYWVHEGRTLSFNPIMTDLSG